MAAEPVHVVGASGRSGAALCRALAAAGTPFVPVVRDAARWAAVGLPEVARIADLADPAALAAALGDARRIASGAHARHAPAILAAAPDARCLVLLGSTRKFTAWPDAHARGVLAGEAAFLAAGRPGVMLHPTMIYGAQGEDNVQRLAALLRRLPLVPLPRGGTALVQPIHQDDVTRCLVAALARDWPGPQAMVVAGPEPVSYAAFVRAVARAAGLAPPRIIPLPLPLLRVGAALARLLPGPSRVDAAELRRLLEDKAFDIGPMRRDAGRSADRARRGAGAHLRGSERQWGTVAQDCVRLRRVAGALAVQDQARQQPARRATPPHGAQQQQLRVPPAPRPERQDGGPAAARIRQRREGFGQPGRRQRERQRAARPQPPREGGHPVRNAAGTGALGGMAARIGRRGRSGRVIGRVGERVIEFFFGRRVERPRPDREPVEAVRR